MSVTREVRSRMVEEQIAKRGITDARVLEAMRQVPREQFIADPETAAHAYEDRPLPIGHGQTISQPYIVAKMAEMAELHPGDNVLEVGAGCGYQTAVLAVLCERVWAIEIVPELAATAQRRLAGMGISNARIECFDGTFGWQAHAPYDAILVAAGAPRVPALLTAQLRDGGRLVVPVGPREDQKLLRVTRRGEDFDVHEDIGVRFVDLTGRFGWGAPVPPRHEKMLGT